MTTLDDEQEAAVAEFIHTIHAYMRAPSEGTRYAMDMAAAEVQLLGLDPSKVTPDGYSCEEPDDAGVIH